MNAVELYSYVVANSIITLSEIINTENNIRSNVLYRPLVLSIVTKSYLALEVTGAEK